MPYIGVSPFNGVRRKHTYTATASQTSFSGAGTEGATLTYKDSTFVDVFQNGVKLGEADYTSTSGTAIVLAQGASVNDLVEVVVYDVFSVADTVSKADGGTFDGNVNVNGTVEINSTTTSDFLVVKTTEAGSGSAPDIVFARDSSSPADNDFLGKIVFRGKNDASEDVEYAQITSQLIDASDGTEDGKLYLGTKVNGSDTNVAVMDSSGVTVAGSITSEGGDNLFRNSSGGSTVSIISGTSNTSILKMGDTDDFDIGQILYHHGVNQMVFHVNDTDFLSINSTGHLFLGTTSERNAGDLSIDFSGSSEGALGLNDTTSSNGSVFAGFLTGGTFRGSITNNNNGAVAYNTTSDYRLKENVSYDFDATARLKQLKPARFNWIADDTNTLQDGFLAHEVSGIVPEAITGTKDGTKTTANVVLDENENIIATGLTEDEWKAGKEIPKDSNGKDLTPMFASNTTWKASITQKHYQEIDQAKLVPLLVKTIQELEARIAVLESK